MQVVVGLGQVASQGFGRALSVGDDGREMAGWEADSPATVQTWRAGRSSEGREACEQPQCRIDLPDEVTVPSHRTATGCLGSLADFAPSFAIRPLNFPVPAGWSRFNPSLAAGPAGISAVVRSGNYAVDDDGNYFVIDGDGVVRSQNYLLHLAAEGTVESVDLISDDRRAHRPTAVSRHWL